MQKKQKYWAKNKLILDPEDEWIKERSNGIYQARRSIYASFPGTRKKFIISRLIMNPPKNLVVDHINRNIFDNRRINLRVCTHSENLRNRKSKNRIRGVRLDPRTKGENKWQAYASVGYRKFKSLGYFKTKTEASKARDLFVKENFGSFAILNSKLLE